MSRARRLGVVEQCPHGEWFTHRRPFWERIRNPKRHPWCSPAWLVAEREDFKAVVAEPVWASSIIREFARGVWDE